MINSKIIITLFLTLALLFSNGMCWSADAEKDRVTQLDGYMNFTGKFEMFSGYLVLQQEPLINVHYLFVTSTKDPKNDDVALWLNGGPGCSSMLGFTQEVGPNMLFSGSSRFSSSENPFSWNQEANLLFFQSPPGVGYSINKDSDYIYNESRTASDNVQALKAWYQRFPEMAQNNFWISGQSYCGMYIPNFASALIDANNEGELINNGTIKFKGVIIGNGVMVTQKHWRREARNKFYSTHNFYGPEINGLINNCQYSQLDDTNPSCIRGNSLADQSVEMVNPYATIGICYTPSQSQANKKLRRRYWYTPFFEQNNPRIGSTELGSGNYTPCTDDSGITAYFNKAKVKQQLHVDSNIQWESCNENIGEIYHKDQSSIQIFEKLKSNNLKILLYSGNTDAIVSYIQTQQYVKKIGWAQTSQKKAYSNNRQSLLGWITEYDGLTVAIINGAGHMVPSDKPNAAYTMFKEFINRA